MYDINGTLVLLKLDTNAGANIINDKESFFINKIYLFGYIISRLDFF